MGGGKTSLQEIFSNTVCMFTCGPGPKTEVGSLSAFVEGVCLCRAGIQQYTDELRDCYVDRGPYFIECEENKQKCMQWLLHSIVHQRGTSKCLNMVNSMGLWRQRIIKSLDQDILSDIPELSFLGGQKIPKVIVSRSIAPKDNAKGNGGIHGFYRSSQ